MLSLKRAQMKLAGAKRPGDGPKYPGQRKQKGAGRKTAGAAGEQSEEDAASENDDVVEFKIKDEENEGADSIIYKGILPQIDESTERARKKKLQAEFSDSSYSGF